MLGNVHNLTLTGCSGITDVSMLGNVHTLRLPSGIIRGSIRDIQAAASDAESDAESESESDAESNAESDAE